MTVIMGGPGGIGRLRLAGRGRAGRAQADPPQEDLAHDPTFVTIMESHRLQGVDLRFRCGQA